MAHRVLTTAFAISLAATACHDWSAFDDVPDTSATEPPRATGGSSGEAGAPETSAPPPGESAVFAELHEKPTVVAGDAQGIVFLTAEGSVLTCAHEGCALPATIASSQKDARGLAIGFGYVAWIARGDQAVRRAPRAAGSGPAEQAKEPNGLMAIALTPSRLYFSVDGATDLIRGNGIRMCTPGLDCNAPPGQFDGFAHAYVTEMRFDGADSFWLADDGVWGCSIAACTKDDASKIAIAKEPLLPFALTLDTDQIYWGSTLEGGSIRVVPRGVLAGGAAAKPPRALATKLGAPSRIAVTASSVWFVDPVGTVGRVPRNGGPVTIVATGLKTPTGIAVGGSWVYVTCAGDGRIFRWRQE